MAWVDPTEGDGSTLTETQRAVVGVFTSAVDVLRASAVSEPVVAAISSGNVTLAVQRLNWDGWGSEIERLEPLSRAEVVAAATRTGQQGVEYLSSRPTPSAGVPLPAPGADAPPAPSLAGPAAGVIAVTDTRARWEFVADDPNVLVWSRQHAGRRVVQLGDEVRQVARREISRGLAERVTAEDVAFRLQAAIPLTERQQRAVWSGAAAASQQVLENGGSVAQAQLAYNRTLEQRVGRALEQRATVIARTEVVTAANQGKLVSWRQAGRAGLIVPRALKQWRTGGGNTCEVCAGLSGKQAPYDQPFDSGVWMPPAHPHCMCSAILLSPNPRLAGSVLWL